MLGKRLKILRERQGMSLTELAERAEVAKSYLSSLERDIQTNPSIQFIEKLADVLDIPVDDLLQDLTDRAEPSVDPEWYSLIQEAIQSGMSLDQFRTFVEFNRFQKEQVNHVENDKKE